MGDFVTREGARLYTGASHEFEEYLTLVQRAFSLQDTALCADALEEVLDTAMILDAQLLQIDDTFDPTAAAYTIPGQWFLDENQWAPWSALWAEDPQLAGWMETNAFGFVIPVTMKETLDELEAAVSALEAGTCPRKRSAAAVAALAIGVPLLGGALYYIWSDAT